MIYIFKKSIHRIIALEAALTMIFLLTSCSSKVSKTEPFSNSTIAMGTVVSQVYYSQDEDVSRSAVTQVTSLINDLDLNKLSRNASSSEISSLNEKKRAELSKVTYKCLRTCLEVSEATDGLFDITIGELSSIWGIGTENARVPSQSEIDSALANIAWRSVAFPEVFYDEKNLPETMTIFIGDNQTVDLGAVGKGLACDEARKILEGTDITGGTVSVGGSILVYGKNPERENGNFLVGVRDPFGSESDFMGVISTKDCCISTSGDYEKVLEADGKKYHHILNPKTGYPAESNVTSVTIVSDSGILSDALSTACFIMGYNEDSLKLLDKFDCEAIFISKDKQVFVTEGLGDKFSITNEEFKMISSGV